MHKSSVSFEISEYVRCGFLWSSNSDVHLQQNVVFRGLMGFSRIDIMPVPMLKWFGIFFIYFWCHSVKRWELYGMSQNGLSKLRMETVRAGWFFIWHLVYSFLQGSSGVVNSVDKLFYFSRVSFVIGAQQSQHLKSSRAVKHLLAVGGLKHIHLTFTQGLSPEAKQWCMY